MVWSLVAFDFTISKQRWNVGHVKRFVTESSSQQLHSGVTIPRGGAKMWETQFNFELWEPFFLFLWGELHNWSEKCCSFIKLLQDSFNGSFQQAGCNCTSFCHVTIVAHSARCHAGVAQEFDFQWHNHSVEGQFLCPQKANVPHQMQYEHLCWRLSKTALTSHFFSFHFSVSWALCSCNVRVVMRPPVDTLSIKKPHDMCWFLDFSVCDLSLHHGDYGWERYKSQTTMLRSHAIPIRMLGSLGQIYLRIVLARVVIVEEISSLRHECISHASHQIRHKHPEWKGTWPWSYFATILDYSKFRAAYHNRFA